MAMLYIIIMYDEWVLLRNDKADLHLKIHLRTHPSNNVVINDVFDADGSTKIEQEN